MATTKFYLDTRGVPESKAAPLKIALTQKGKTVLIGLDVRLMRNQWDKVTEKISGLKNKQFLNTYIHKRKQDMDEIILSMSGEIGRMTAAEIKRRILLRLVSQAREDIVEEENTFMYSFLSFTNSKTGRTKEIYTATYNRIYAYLGERATELQFEDITKEWLMAFDAFLMKAAPSKKCEEYSF